MKLKNYIRLFKEKISEYKLIHKNSFLFVLDSGGKDSSAMSYLFKEYSKNKPELRIEYLNVVFPQMVFGKGREKIKEKAVKIGKDLSPFESRIAETDHEELGRTNNPCLLCKEVRRKIIAEMIATKKKNNITIATGHNNYDLLAYFIELFGISYKELVEKGIDYNNLKKITISDEHLEHFSRFFPKLELNSGITLIKPMLVFSRLEVEDILKQTNIPGFLEHCPYATERPKRNLFNFLAKQPEDKVKKLVDHDTHKKMLEVLKEKVDNFDEAFEKVKKMEYSELIL
ncbi:hypothetical protein AYK26_01965 [Euryarchaeota archaeon SM23-78]|nr:MAG: hypothetical protein AYK26_01965 [Euryarchaeota archaeon SM23-78]MBW3000315.1 hypothetical protein [Candidatus Woesearchaeota archaeon]